MLSRFQSENLEVSDHDGLISSMISIYFIMLKYEKLNAFLFLYHLNAPFILIKDLLVGHGNFVDEYFFPHDFSQLSHMFYTFYGTWQLYIKSEIIVTLTTPPAS